MSGTSAVGGMLILFLLAGCAEEKSKRAPVPAEVTGVEWLRRGVTEVEISIFNPHSEAAEIECDLVAEHDAMSILLTVPGDRRKALASNLHGLKRDTRAEDVAVKCWRIVEE